jgi:DNA-binding beta-propeller fold protein YncE
VFVVDTLNQRIQKFDPDLNFVSKWGIVGKEPGQFYNPSGICLSWEPDWAPQDE